MRIVVRVFVDQKLILRENLDVKEEDLDQLLSLYAKRHAAAIVTMQGWSPQCLHMIEFECLDEPMESRFLRFGTDSRMMRNPIPMDLNDN